MLDKFPNAYLIVGTYTFNFQRYAKWFYLNGIEYELHETDRYDNGLLIVINKPKEKAKRRLIEEVYIRKVSPYIQRLIIRESEQYI